MRQRHSLPRECVIPVKTLPGGFERVAKKAAEGHVRVDDPQLFRRWLRCQFLGHPVGKHSGLATTRDTAYKPGLAVQLELTQPLLLRAQYRPQRLSGCNLAADG